PFGTNGRQASVRPFPSAPTSWTAASNSLLYRPTCPQRQAPPRRVVEKRPLKVRVQVAGRRSPATLEQLRREVPPVIRVGRAPSGDSFDRRASVLAWERVQGRVTPEAAVKRFQHTAEATDEFPAVLGTGGQRGLELLSTEAVPAALLSNWPVAHA